MELNRDNRTGDFRNLRIIFFAMLAGQLLFAAVTYFLVSTDGGLGQAEFLGGDVVPYLALYIFVMVGGAYYLDRTRANNAARRKYPNYRAAMNSYRTTVIIRSAIVEAAVLLTLIVALLTGNLTVLLIALVGSAAFFLFRPSEEEFEARYGRV